MRQWLADIFRVIFRYVEYRKDEEYGAQLIARQKLMLERTQLVVTVDGEPILTASLETMHYWARWGGSIGPWLSLTASNGAPVEVHTVFKVAP